MPPDLVRVQAVAGVYIRKADRYENLPVLAGKPNFNLVRKFFIYKPLTILDFFD
jgi:hypothetical protein